MTDVPEYHPDNSDHTPDQCVAEALETFVMTISAGESATRFEITKIVRTNMRRIDNVYFCEMDVEAIAEFPHGRTLHIKTIMPLCGEATWQHAEQFFAVAVDDSVRYLSGIHVLWSSRWMYDSFDIITTYENDRDGFWRIGDGFEHQVRYIGPRWGMPEWALREVNTHYPRTISTAFSTLRRQIGWLRLRAFEATGV